MDGSALVGPPGSAKERSGLAVGRVEALPQDRPRRSQRPLGARMVRALRREWRRLQHRLSPPAMRLVYNAGYERAMLGVPLDPLRADRILAFLANERLILRDEIAVARTVALKNVLLVHTPAYLRSLQRPETVAGILGTPVGEDEIEEVIDLQRLMAGGTIHASRLALDACGVAVNLGGGFHHAERERGMGFCIFNDIAIAIARLRNRGFVGRILVVDLDLHDGNGTRAIFAEDDTVHTYSVHNEHWGPTDVVAATSIALGGDVGDDLYLSTLLKTLPPIVEEFEPRLVFFLAGCDVAADDRLGNWRISPEGIFARDRFVVSTVRSRQIPLVVVLGGGYGDGAWRYTAKLVGWLLSGAEISPPDNDELTLLRFRQIKAHLDPLRLTQGATTGGWELTEEDLVGILPGVPHQTRFLNYFSRVGLELILEQFGIFEQLRARGFRRPFIQLDLDHPLGQTLRIFGGPDNGELLVELRVNRSARALPGMEVLLVEWLLLQNPRESFSPDRRPLPGQNHPGLGMLREIFGLLVILCEALDLDGLLFNPSSYHVAALSSRFIAFLDPGDEAFFRALQGTLAGLPLDEASGAVHDGRVVDAASGETVTWPVCRMVLPVSERLRERIASEEYETEVARTRESLRFRLADRRRQTASP